MRNWFLRNGATKGGAYLDFAFMAVGICIAVAFTIGFAILAGLIPLAWRATGNPFVALMALPLIAEVFVASVLLYLRRVRNEYERADAEGRQRMRDEAGIV